MGNITDYPGVKQIFEEPFSIIRKEAILLFSFVNSIIVVFSEPGLSRSHIVYLKIEH